MINVSTNQCVKDVSLETHLFVVWIWGVNCLYGYTILYTIHIYSIYVFQLPSFSGSRRASILKKIRQSAKILKRQRKQWISSNPTLCLFWLTPYLSLYLHTLPYIVQLKLFVDETICRRKDLLKGKSIKHYQEFHCYCLQVYLATGEYVAQWFPLSYLRIKMDNKNKLMFNSYYNTLDIIS